MKKRIQSSHLALRFYAHDGWTKKELDALCTRGEVKCNFPSDPYPYFCLDHEQSSAFDVDRLMEKMSELDRGAGVRPAARRTESLSLK